LPIFVVDKEFYLFKNALVQAREVKRDHATRGCRVDVAVIQKAIGQSSKLHGVGIRSSNI
jgi:hypothetical protein